MHASHTRSRAIALRQTLCDNAAARNAHVRAFGLVLAGFALLLALLGCNEDPGQTPPVLRVSAIPDQAPEKVRAQHQELMRQVCGIARIGCEWIDVASYEELVDRIGRGEVDLAYLGGATFARAHHRHGVAPLAMRDIDLRFMSTVVVRAADPAKTLADLRGKRFAFGAPSSTSGHFMARHFLRKEGLDPERDFAKVVFSGGHDATLNLVIDGQVDAGVVNSAIAYKALAAADGMAKQFRVLWLSPPFADYVWAARKELPQALRQRLTDSFLDMDRTQAEHRIVLEAEQASGYIPAYARQFESVAKALRQAGHL